MMARRSSPLGRGAAAVDLGGRKDGDVDRGTWRTAALSMRPTRLTSWVCGRPPSGVWVAMEAKVLESLLMVACRNKREWERERVREREKCVCVLTSFYGEMVMMLCGPGSKQFILGDNVVRCTSPMTMDDLLSNYGQKTCRHSWKKAPLLSFIIVSCLSTSQILYIHSVRQKFENINYCLIRPIKKRSSWFSQSKVFHSLKEVHVDVRQLRHRAEEVHGVVWWWVRTFGFGNLTNASFFASYCNLKAKQPVW